MAGKIERAALAAAKRGLHVFPLAPGSKKPMAGSAGFKDATLDADQIKAWFKETPDANYGISTGPSNLCVVDVDPKNGGLETERELAATEGTLPPTFTVSTPSGGHHLYYLLGSEDDPIASSGSRVGKGVDIRSSGGYVVGPGCHTPRGPYAVKVSGVFSPLSSALHRHLRGGSGLALAGSRVAARNGRSTEEDLPINIERARTWINAEIEAGRVAIEGEGGNDFTYRTASVIRDFGVSRTTALEILEPWNDACNPPWDEAELNTVVRNAYAYSQREPGERAFDTEAKGRLLAAAGLSSPKTRTAADGDRDTAEVKDRLLEAAGLPKTGETPDAKRGPDTGQSAIRNIFVEAAVDATAFASEGPPNWLVDQMLVEAELVQFYGPWGSYKTFFALDLALHIATGREWNGRPVCQGPVVYFCGEGSRGIGQRVLAWEAHHERLEYGAFSRIPLVPILGNNDHIDMCLQAIRHFSATVAIFDTQAYATVGGDENSSQDAGGVVAGLQHIIRATGCSPILIHHSGKDISRGGRGSNVIPAACETIFELSTPAINSVIVEMKKQRNSEKWEKEMGFRVEHVDPSAVLIQEDITRQRGNTTRALYVMTAIDILEEEGASLPIKAKHLAEEIARRVVEGDNWAAAVPDIADSLRRTLGAPGQPLEDYVTTRTDSGRASTYGRKD